MSSIPGWAFTPNEKEEGERRVARYKEIQHLRKKMHLRVSPAYGMTHYTGEVPEGESLSDLDILLICDSGNTCFGGSVTRSSKGFRATVFTD